LLVGTAALGVIVVATSIYTYERYYRGPDETALVGTWQEYDPIMECTYYHRLKPDHTFEVFTQHDDQPSVLMRGTWHAGGDIVYLKLAWEDVSATRLIIWRIEEMTANELRIRYNPGGRVHTYTRATVDSPNASNQAMERTATRRAFTLCVATTSSLRAARVPGGRRSSCSR
jgi:hypothetical protein